MGLSSSAIQCRQTNSEGEFIKWCHDAYDNTDGMVVNPGAWSHYAWSIHDALEPLTVPVVEVHLSNVDEREEWRRKAATPATSAPRLTGHSPRADLLGLPCLSERHRRV